MADDQAARQILTERTRQYDELLPPPPSDQPRILLWDIETTPLLGWAWEMWKTDLMAVEQDWHLLCFSYQWWEHSDVGYLSLRDNPQYRRNKQDDRWLVRRLHRLLDQADATVAHNGHKFDRRKANLRFSVHSLGPPSPYVEIDTLSESRRFFAPYSHRLDSLGKIHGFGEKKKHTGLPLWLGCMRGDDAAWQTMEEYSRQDLVLLGDWYRKLVPWIGHPGFRAGLNRGLWQPEIDKCPKCGATGHWWVRRGTRPHRTGQSVFQSLRCKSCGGYSRVRRRDRGFDGPV